MQLNVHQQPTSMPLDMTTLYCANPGADHGTPAAPDRGGGKKPKAAAKPPKKKKK